MVQWLGLYLVIERPGLDSQHQRPFFLLLWYAIHPRQVLAKRDLITGGPLQCVSRPMKTVLSQVGELFYVVQYGWTLLFSLEIGPVTQEMEKR